MARIGKTALYLGGARSGKSRLAQQRAEAMPGELLYFATARAGDVEMAERIARHQSDRSERWHTVEVPMDLPQALSRSDGAGRVLLVDCLTLWLSNLLLDDCDVPAAQEALLSVLDDVEATVLLVSNEVGMGIVPDNALARRFRDEAGRLHQQIAARADEVWFVAAGLGLPLKGSTTSLPAGDPA